MLVCQGAGPKEIYIPPPPHLDKASELATVWGRISMCVCVSVCLLSVSRFVSLFVFLGPGTFFRSRRLAMWHQGD